MGVPAMTLKPGAGGGATGNVSGFDSDGVITINTAGVPSANDVVASLAYNEPYDRVPVGVLLTPANAAAADLGTGTVFIPPASLTVDGFDIESSTTPLASGVTYMWYFRVVR